VTTAPTIALAAFGGEGWALDLIELATRWLHVVAAAMWVGAGWWSAWALRPLRARDAEAPSSAGVDAALGAWLRATSAAAAGLGVVLLFLSYYSPRTANLTGAVPEAGDWMTALIVLLVAVGAYDAGARLLSSVDLAGQALGAAITLGFAWFCAERLGFSARATHVHAGALLGAMMGNNVWMRIAPARDGEARLVPSARAAHNAWFALAALALMLGAGQPGFVGLPVLPTLGAVLGTSFVGAVGLGAAWRGALRSA